MTRAGAAALVALAPTAGCASPVWTSVRCTTTKRTRRSSSGHLERGEYRYDAHDHHGPTLYYLTLPSAWLRGQQDLRLVSGRSHAPRCADAVRRGNDPPVAAASAGIGRPAVVTAAMLMALSPAMVFYSRMHIQEALFACFALAFVIGVGRVWPPAGSRVGGDDGRGGRARDGDERDRGDRLAVRRRGRRDCVVVGWSRRAAPLLDRHLRRATLVGLATAAGVAALLFVVPDRAWCMVEPFRGAGTYLDRGIDPAMRSLGLLPAAAHRHRVRRPALE